ncbi:hypothetical protein ACIBIZ_02915 [Nonomuraea spiralis]|uniref:AI-2E family transporter n=1 Tax=Nonomuraea spiralis TaxID=46182 RepID=A0ABV5ICK9_9ACTN|nr:MULTISPECIES: hypothetical protein [Nonomuraea]GGT04433.1 hypothetical protein GCM10010176_055870 [Nonomuraea spiralis]
MNEPLPRNPLPPEPRRERPDVTQAVLTATVIVIVLAWPDLIPFVSVVLALLGLRQSSR